MDEENRTPQTLEKRVQGAMLEYAFLRWESAGIISATILLTLSMFPDWLWIGCLLFGAIGEAALVYTSLTDSETRRRIRTQVIEKQIKNIRPERLRDSALQQKVKKAIDYYQGIDAAKREARDSILTKHLSATTSQIGEWLWNIYGLARRLDRFQEKKKSLETDKREVNTRIHRLQKQLQGEHDGKIKQQLQQTIEGRRLHLETLGRLENIRQHAELQLERALSDLGTIYSQTMLIEARDMNGERMTQLRREISEKAAWLGDFISEISAMDDE